MFPRFNYLKFTHHFTSADEKLLHMPSAYSLNVWRISYIVIPDIMAVIVKFCGIIPAQL